MLIPWEKCTRDFEHVFTDDIRCTNSNLLHLKLVTKSSYPKRTFFIFSPSLACFEREICCSSLCTAWDLHLWFHIFFIRWGGWTSEAVWQGRYETVGSGDKAELWLLEDFKLNPQIKRVSYKYLCCSPPFYRSYIEETGSAFDMNLSEEEVCWTASSSMVCKSFKANLILLLVFALWVGRNALWKTQINRSWGELQYRASEHIRWTWRLPATAKETKAACAFPA